jgi:hypothetical protein
LRRTSSEIFAWSRISKGGVLAVQHEELLATSSTAPVDRSALTFSRARAHAPDDRDDVLRPQRLRGGEELSVAVPEEDLGHAPAVAQVDEDEVGVVAHRVDPAVQGDAPADVLGTELAAGVRAPGVCAAACAHLLAPLRPTKGGAAYRDPRAADLWRAPRRALLTSAPRRSRPRTAGADASVVVTKCPHCQQSIAGALPTGTDRLHLPVVPA